MKKLVLLAIIPLLFSLHGHAQRISQEAVCRDLVADAWKYMSSIDLSVFSQPKYAEDHYTVTIYPDLVREANPTSTIKSFLYTPYPLVYVVPDPFQDGVSICYIPINNEMEFVKLVESITGLKYAPDSPDTVPEEGLYSLSGNGKTVKDAEGEYFIYDSCTISVHERFPEKVGGCAVRVDFAKLID